MTSYDNSVVSVERAIPVAPADRLPRLNPRRRLRVLTLTPFYPTEGDDSSGCFIAEPLRALESKGIRNSVIVATPFYRSTRAIARTALPAVSVKYFSLPKGFGLSSAGAFLFASIVRTVRELAAQGPVDLVHAHGALPCGHAASLLFRELGIPYVVSVHGLDAYSDNQVKGLPGGWCERVSRMTYESAQRVICVSDQVKTQVTKGGNFSAEVVYNGVDPEIFSPAQDSVAADPVILSVGNLIPSKGHALLLRAFARLLEHFHQIRCEIVGEGPDREKLLRLAAELGIQDRVTFHGRLSRKQVAVAMRRCTVFALPSSYEALGCVYLEAMECAKPIVACYGQGIEEIIQNGQNGLLVEPENLEDLMEALSRLLADEALRRRLAASGHRTVHQNVTVAHQAQNLARIYAECAR